MTRIFKTIALLIFVFNGVWGNESFFESEDIVSIRLEAPISTLKKQRGDNKLDWLPSTLKWVDAEGKEYLFDVKIKARGNFRRQRSTCTFPPYWINFKKSQLKGTDLEGLDKVKIVSHCRDGYDNFDQYIYKEYLCYRTFNLMTDKSFGVRLLHIEYVDTDRKKQVTRQNVGFMIESVDSVEERLESTLIKDRFVLPSLVSKRDLCLAELFQFFVGNTDFSFFASEDECCHNGKVFAPNNGAVDYIPVPYDFDLSGIVNTPYAQVDPNFPNQRVTDRLYRGMGVSRKDLQDSMNAYGRKKNEIYSLWRDSGLLNDYHLKTSIKFIDEFYEFLRVKKKRKREVISKLRNLDGLEKIIQEDMEKDRVKKEKKAARSN